MQISPIRFFLIKPSIKAANLVRKYSQTGIQWLLQHQPQPSCQRQLKRENNELLTKESTPQVQRTPAWNQRFTIKDD